MMSRDESWWATMAWFMIDDAWRISFKINQHIKLQKEEELKKKIEENMIKDIEEDYPDYFNVKLYQEYMDLVNHGTLKQFK